ncbi:MULTISPECIES: SIMPL domain-containing protein [unclassified Neochlamydia]|uniref:SIMPL domain-containing protein n=1 Tax=unclassified Neochlamydia TaxID=2643326 RepID=UPI001BCA6195|nr:MULTISPECIES: SIMPL domain-containing protein [unclassified Neochlamydia]MBS4170853.1 Uncharacterized protein [Neochlamydia sp. AcF95]
MMFKVLTLLLCLFLGEFATAAEAPTLSLKGQAVLHKQADQISLTIGVTNLGAEAASVLAENSKKMQNIIRELNKKGFDKSEYQTGQFSIQPTYTLPPQNPPAGWRPTINGYEVSNTLKIKTDKIKEIGALIDTAHQAGANKIDHIYASLKDERVYWEEAVAKATKNAIADAKVMAEAAQVKLNRLLSISLNDTLARSPQSLTPMFLKTMASELTPIEPGDIEIKANVNVVYEIDKLE